MTFTYRPAARSGQALLLALSGPSWSGKTTSALHLARGLAGPDGKIAFLDTENGRARYYADDFTFDHEELKPPFRPERYQEAIVAADEAGYPVIVVDSMSHEWNGEGGLLEWADQELVDNPRMKPPLNWSKPKTAHKQLINRVLQLKAHVIFCLRADPKIEILREDGKTKINQLGFQPICEKSFMFEMAVKLELGDGEPGVPTKAFVRSSGLSIFQEGQQITEAHGQALAAWAAGKQATRAGRGMAAGAAGAGALRPTPSGPAAGASSPAAGAATREAVIMQFDDAMDSDWESWGYLVEQRLDGCQTDTELAAETAANKTLLEECRTASPEMGRRLGDAWKAAKDRVGT